MFFQHIFTPSLGINSYILGDEKTKRCVVIDPTRHIVPYIIKAQNAGLDITDILETHVHADFVSGSKELKHQLNGKACIRTSGMGGEQWIPTYTDEVVYQGTELKIGDICLKALHTPGHTPEHITWVCYDYSRSSNIPWFAFTGDCLFVDSVGRPDLLGSQNSPFLASELYHTLFDVFASLPDFVEIFPSHGNGSLCGKSLSKRSSSTFGFERLFNSYLKKESKNSWISNLLKSLPPVPAYFRRLKKINLEGPPLLSSLKTTKWDKENQLLDLDMSELFLVDSRHPEVFANFHIKGSLNIPLSSHFSQWAGWMLPEKIPLGLITANSHDFNEVVDQLRLMGFDQDIWMISLDESHPPFPYSTASFSVIDVKELIKYQPKFESFYLLDVRSSEEWRSGHILGAHHLELNQLENSLEHLPYDQTIVLLCRSGIRASLAASLLRKHGFMSVLNVRGGMEAWRQSGFPMRIENGNIGVNL